ncbi:MAG: DUF488 domain-containing protein [Gaiellales bacterium]
MSDSSAPTIFTIGHSNRELVEFTDLLEEQGIERLIDIRAFPGSRRNPHFGTDALADSVHALAMEYVHLRDLGGRRRTPADAPGIGCGDAWRNASFRSYAEYVQSPEYEQALDELIAMAGEQRVAIMCSEAVPWRCHRWLVSDTLVARGIRVVHVLSSAEPRLHQISSFAKVTGEHVTWPGPESTASLKLGPPVSETAAQAS